MPLRDHFRPPLSARRSWEGFHGGWSMMIVEALNRNLPDRYVAEPQVHLGSSIEIDVATFAADGGFPQGVSEGGVATAVWSPPEPTLAVATDLPDIDEYEVRVHDVGSGRRLVAAVELVSPANKGRPDHRRAFVAKCAGLLQQQVAIAIVDVVTTRSANLYAELLEFLGSSDHQFAAEPPALYAVACRVVKGRDSSLLETWDHPVALGRSLPVLPLWLAPDLAVPLDLEQSYEATCRVLRIA